MVLGHIVIMLSLNTTSYIQDSLVQTFESVSEASCQNSQILTKKALLLLVLYYLPVFIALMYITLQLAKLLKCTKYKRERYVLCVHKHMVYLDYSANSTSLFMMIKLAHFCQCQNM